MSSVDDVIDHVDRLRIAVRPREAEEMLAALIQELGADELRVWEPELRACLSRFLPKRAARLKQTLENALRTVGSSMPAGAAGPSAISREVRLVLDKFQGDLTDLSNRYIFQWSTWYREVFAGFAVELLSATRRGASPASAWPQIVRELVDAHSHEIFSKGYEFTCRTGHSYLAHSKARSGLQRFLDIAVELYASHLAQEPPANEARVLRSTVSAVVGGILRGFARCSFGGITGAQLLATDRDSWLHVVAVLTETDLGAFVEIAEKSFPVATFSESLIFSSAVDRLVALAKSRVPLPSVAEPLRKNRLLRVTFSPSPGVSSKIGIRVLLAFGPNAIGVDVLEMCAEQEIDCIIGHPNDEARAYLSDHPYFDHRLIDATIEQSPILRTARVLELTAFKSSQGTAASQPIRHNFARDFPITNQFLTRFYRVDRPSVRDLLRTVERRNGIRLWCSVRRSGKTTAGLDLGSVTSEIDVITQTCDDTGQNLQEQIVYSRVVEALESGRHLPSSFLERVIEECGSQSSSDGGRKVLVLDEYETLFGKLSAEAESDPRIRYAVVQPLLNQFVTFSRDNLVIFLGQQPTAHHILMDQNQLSPYVIQDSFPLFTHGSMASEFTELIQRILTSRVGFDQEFATRVFTETAGHPYMTVNLMVELVEWLIETERRADRLQLSGVDYDEFFESRMTRSHMAESSNLQFFRDAVAGEALGTLGRMRTPWLHAVYALLRHICLESPSKFSLTREEFADAFRRLGLDEGGLTPEYILSTGVSANFFGYDRASVTPRIRLLGRLSTVAPIRLGTWW